MMRFRLIAVLGAAAVLVWFFWPGPRPAAPEYIKGHQATRAEPVGSAPASAEASLAAATAEARIPGPPSQSSPPATFRTYPVAPAAATLPEFVSPIAAELNSPVGNIAGDLEILSRVLDDWRANHPRSGNPVGENAAITATLTQPDDRGFVHLPPDHPAINAAGELCDRWGTPFRFHQISGEHMEIRSAGPDRKFGTNDDVTGLPAR